MRCKVAFSCGHTGYMQIGGDERARAGRIRWMEENGICPKCYTKRLNEERSEGCDEVTMPYSEYKMYHEGCETKKGSYHKKNKPVTVFIPRRLYDQDEK